MKSAEQLKGKVKSLSQKTGTSSSLILQKFVLDRFLYQVQKSEYSDNFIVKGGMVISEIAGIQLRTTMDIDFTLRNFPLEKEKLKGVIQKICEISNPDHLKFSLKRIQNIRKDDFYGGMRVSMEALYQEIKIPFKLDITTGDVITPSPERRSFTILVDGVVYLAFAYNLESILAEKIETIFSRGIANTRPRDYHDIYLLLNAKDVEINYKLFQEALINTTNHRNSSEILDDMKSLQEDIKNSKDLLSHWKRYQNEFPYAKEIDFNETTMAIETLINKLK